MMNNETVYQPQAGMCSIDTKAVMHKRSALMGVPSPNTRPRFGRPAGLRPLPCRGGGYVCATPANNTLPSPP